VKNKDEAKAEGFKRGLAGKVGNASVMQGWRDDQAAGDARTQGYMEGKRRRARLTAAQTARDKK
jgi:hypothetical protein